PSAGRRLPRRLDLFPYRWVCRRILPMRPGRPPADGLPAATARKNKKPGGAARGAAAAPGPYRRFTSTLGELRSLAGLLEAVLVAFLHAGIPRQEALLLKGRPVFRLHFQQSPGHTVPDRSRRAAEAAARHGGN